MKASPEGYCWGVGFRLKKGIANQMIGDPK